MRTRPTILFFSPEACPVPALVRQWATANAFPLLVFSQPEEVEAIVLRGHPCLLFVDGNGTPVGRRAAGARAQARRVHGDRAGDGARRRPPCGAGAGLVRRRGGRSDHRHLLAGGAAGSRLDAMLVRTERDVSVHPSTRLPGTTEIEREIRRRLESEMDFAVCYADLDHFKEFNDRYSYYDGDRVIYLLSRILHDVVKGLLGPRGFVGHIGGDDFIFVVPGRGDQPGLQRDPGRVRHADSAAVQRPGPARRLLLRQGPARAAAPGAVDDPLDRHRHQPPSAVCASGAGERACHRDEELRQDPAGIGVRGRPAAGAPTARSAPGRDPENSREDGAMNVTCPNCATVYRIDPAKVPETGVRARCSICSAVFAVRREGEAPDRPAAAAAGVRGQAPARTTAAGSGRRRPRRRRRLGQAGAGRAGAARARPVLRPRRARCVRAVPPPAAPARHGRPAADVPSARRPRAARRPAAPAGSAPAGAVPPVRRAVRWSARSGRAGRPRARPPPLRLRRRPLPRHRQPTPAPASTARPATGSSAR